MVNNKINIAFKEPSEQYSQIGEEFKFGNIVVSVKHINSHLYPKKKYVSLGEDFPYYLFRAKFLTFNFEGMSSPSDSIELSEMAKLIADDIINKVANRTVFGECSAIALNVCYGVGNDFVDQEKIIKVNKGQLGYVGV